MEESRLSNLRMDKTALSIGSLFDESDEKAYWLSQTPEERLEALELMRQIVYGYEEATAPGFQRVLELATRQTG